MFIIDRVNEIDEGRYYTSVKQHRENVNDDKSVWTITIEEEIFCFKRSIENSWIDITPKYAWGIHLIGSSIRLEILGKNRENEYLKIAKFIKDDTSESWHGYPADYRKKKKDKPPEKVLLEWRAKGYIEKHHMGKIRSGRICNL
jgi:hypothetical protein